MCAFVYGFEFMRSQVKLRGSDKFYIGTKGTGGSTIYYGIKLKSTCLDDIQKEIADLSETQQKIISEFDKFAEKYDKKATWMLACVGDVNVNIIEEPRKECLLERFQEWERDIERLYNDDGSITEDADDCIVCIFGELNMDFMIERARKAKTFEEIYEMIENYYTE